MRATAQVSWARAEISSKCVFGRVQGLEGSGGFRRVQGLGFKVQGSRLGVRVQAGQSRGQGLWCRVQGLGVGFMTNREHGPGYSSGCKLA